MDLNLTPVEQAFRDEFRSWLQANLPEPWTKGGVEYIDYLRRWQRKLFDGGIS